jgi:hypothetical protein
LKTPVPAAYKPLGDSLRTLACIHQSRVLQ